MTFILACAFLNVPFFVWNVVIVAGHPNYWVNILAACVSLAAFLFCFSKYRKLRR